MKTPGLYQYDNALRKKRSHNKSNNPAFICEEKRFSKSISKTDIVPGPGHYNVGDEGTSSVSQFHTYVQNLGGAYTGVKIAGLKKDKSGLLSIEDGAYPDKKI